MDEDFTWADRYRHIMPTNLTHSPYTTQYANPTFNPHAGPLLPGGGGAGGAACTQPAHFAAGETALPPGYAVA